MTTHSAASAAIKTLQALGYTHYGGELWKPPIGQAPNFDLIDNMRMRFVVCPKCGNKRCPQAHNHDLACTGSNAVGQPGSSWEHVEPPTGCKDGD